VIDANLYVEYATCKYEGDQVGISVVVRMHIL